MRIMTFNLRFENDRDGENSWINRRELVVQVIERYNPAVLGTQEGTLKQLAYLQENLSNYRMHAPGRPFDDETCQYPTLFYRSDDLRLIEGSEFWLSKTPQVHRSKDWDSAFPRMMSDALLERSKDGRRLWVAVTHLDNIGVEARREQAGLVVKRVAQQSVPVILMGDFNSLPGSTVYNLLTSSAAGLRDSWRVLGNGENRDSMTHHGFRGTPQKGRLDWILVGERFRVLDAIIVRDHSGGRYPSDHFPYLIQVDW